MMKRILPLCLIFLFAATAIYAQVNREGKMEENILVGVQKYFNTVGQKMAEVVYSDNGELLSYKTWDEKGLLMDEERIPADRKKAELPTSLEWTFLENGMGFLIIHGRAEDNAPKALPGERVAVHYELMLQDRTLVEETYSKKKPFKFKAGEGEVIPGFEQAVGMLKVGEEGYFWIPADLAYGSQAMGLIPPFASLLYRIKFVDLN